MDSDGVASECGWVECGVGFGKVDGDSGGVRGCWCVAYWKEERGPQLLPSLPFFVSSSVGGSSNWNGHALVVVVVRTTCEGSAMPVLWSCVRMLRMVVGLFDRYMKHPFHSLFRSTPAKM